MLMNDSKAYPNNWMRFGIQCVYMAIHKRTTELELCIQSMECGYHGINFTAGTHIPIHLHTGANFEAHQDEGGMNSEASLSWFKPA